jgi:hypothetical protein
MNMKKTFFVTMMAVCSMNMQAQFSGQGSGTEKDPYQVTNADELFEVRNDVSAYYKQMNDIDLEAWIQEESPVKGWPSIGTATAPFMGYYDGNNKAIKGLKIVQPNTDKIGLFGVILEGEVKNLALINVQVEGGNDVGGLVGYVDGKVNKVKAKTTFSNIIIVGGNISGKQNVGSVVGRIYINSFGTGNKGQATITGCFSSSQVNGVDNIGGIVGLAGSWNWGSSEFYPLYITDNRYSGTVVATGGYAGGIWGKEYVDRSDGVGWKGYRQFHCLRNICGGTIRGTKGASGILGSPFDGTPDDSRIIWNNVCVADTIATTEATPSIVNSVVFSGNYGLTTTVYYSKGKVVSAASDDDNIQLYGKKAFMRSSTYMGLDFDFNNQWAITEGVDFPYNITQSSPATVTEFVAGSRGKIKGTAKGTGKVYVLMGNGLFESYIFDGKWEVILGNTLEGSEAFISVVTDGKQPSTLVKCVATSFVTPQKTAGDANGDGVVDSADVTAIINFILGKPGASFNKENADVTGDGEILIDDAVQTVQMIMDAQ